MDYNQATLDSGMSDFGKDLQLTSTAKSYLLEATKWARLIAIVGFVFVGLFVVIALIIGVSMGSTAIPGLGVGGGVFSVIYILLAALYFFPLLYLFRFANKTRYALERQDSSELEVGIENLKANLKFIGILLLAIIGFYILAIVLIAVTGVAGFMN